MSMSILIHLKINACLKTDVAERTLCCGKVVGGQTQLAVITISRLILTCCVAEKRFS